MSTYRVIRCPGCHQFTYTDYYGKWKLCPVCGEVISVRNVPVYLEVDDFSEAEVLIKEVERYMSHTGRFDLTREEVDLIREGIWSGSEAQPYKGRVYQSVPQWGQRIASRLPHRGQ